MKVTEANEIRFMGLCRLCKYRRVQRGRNTNKYTGKLSPAYLLDAAEKYQNKAGKAARLAEMGVRPSEIKVFL